MFDCLFAYKLILNDIYAQAFISWCLNPSQKQLAED